MADTLFPDMAAPPPHALQQMWHEVQTLFTRDPLQPVCPWGQQRKRSLLLSPCSSKLQLLMGFRVDSSTDVLYGRIFSIQRASLRMSRMVWDLTLASGPKMVLLSILSQHNDAKGYAFPSVARLAKRCSFHERTGQTYIATLVKCDTTSGLSTSVSLAIKLLILRFS